VVVVEEEAMGMAVLHNSNTARTTRRWDGDAAIVGRET